MTISELRQALDAVPAHEASTEVKIWLPGSLIRLASVMGVRSNKLSVEPVLMIEGNVDSGSALE